MRLTVTQTAPLNCHLMLAQRGATLVELLVASLLSLLVIGVIGSMFISSQNSALSLSRQLMLSQNLSSAMAQLKEDAERAGYNGQIAYSLKLSAASDILTVSSGALGFVYRQPEPTSDPLFHVVYRLEALSSTHNSLKICEKSSAQLLTMVSAAASGSGGYCYALFDPNLINITSFSVTSGSLVGENAKRQSVELSLNAALIEWPQVTQQLSLQIHSGNWQ